MTNLKKTLGLLSLVFTFPILLTGQSNCLPATAMEELNIGMIKATVLNAGDNFWNLQNAGFEVPKGSEKHSIFTQGIWLGGIDDSNNLYTAAMSYRQTGNDFWPGPVSNSNSLTDYTACLDYDKIWKVDRFEVEKFKALHGTPGYTIPKSILDWPANGDLALGQDAVLAPYEDVNGDGVYNPIHGDYPKFSSATDCDGIKGDQVVYKIYNDVGNIHTESGGEALGFQILEATYAFLDTGYLGYQVFSEYYITNKSTRNYHDLYFGNWLDIDIGDYQDDYVGCHVVKGISYGYNGDNDDAGSNGYGLYPPAVGAQFLGAPLARENDGLDNDFDGTVDETGEQLQMSSFLYYNGVNGTGDGQPLSAADFYNYLQAIWLDNQPVTYGENGRNFNNPQTKFMFPGASDPTGIATGGVPQTPWNEASAGNTPADRRFIASLGPIDLAAGESFEITLNYGWARAGAGASKSSLSKLLGEMDTIKDIFNNCFQNRPCPPALLSLNPIQNGVHFEFEWTGFANQIQWNFGDGSTSNDLYPKHSYSSQGVYPVSYVAISDCDTSVGTINVEAYFDDYLVGPQLTRVEGTGNGGQKIELTDASIQQILNHNSQDVIAYKSAQGPLLVYTFDKSAVPFGDYEIRISPGSQTDPQAIERYWRLVKVGSTDTVWSDKPVTEFNNQYVSQYGLWVRTNGFDPDSPIGLSQTENLYGSTNKYISFLKDTDERFSSRNWVKSGTREGDYKTLDDEETFERNLNGWAPYRLVSSEILDSSGTAFKQGGGPAWIKFQAINSLDELHSAKVVFTNDKNLWTRAAVIETGEDISLTVGGARKMDLRKSPSVDKSGLADGSGDGFGWFPGYAINTETGEQLCIMFGENSIDGLNNGTDMLFNPTDVVESPNPKMNPATLGGRHYIYILKYPYTGDDETQHDYYPLITDNNGEPADHLKREVYKQASWVSIPIKKQSNLVPHKYAVNLHVSKKYDEFETSVPVENNRNPRYLFSTQNISVINQEPIDLEVFPNPSSDQIHIKTDLKISHGQFSLIDVQGRLVFTEDFNSSQAVFNVASLAKGSYVFILDLDGTILHGKQILY